MDLQDWLTLRGITASAFAELAGLDQGHLSRIMRGERWPKTETIAAISKATDGKVTADDLHAAYTAAKAAKADQKQTVAAE